MLWYQPFYELIGIDTKLLLVSVTSCSMMDTERTECGAKSTKKIDLMAIDGNNTVHTYANSKYDPSTSEKR
jgi:hypothetical protein